MISVIVNLAFLILAAIPVAIYFLRCEDRVLSGWLLALAALFVFSGKPYLPSLAVLENVWIAVAVCAVHWCVWIAFAVTRGNVRGHLLPLLTVSSLLLTNVLYLGGAVTLILTVAYTVLAVHIYRAERTGKVFGTDEKGSEAPLTGVFKEFAPQRILYVNEKRKEYEENPGD